jgi:hypothetical protein
MVTFLWSLCLAKTHTVGIDLWSTPLNVLRCHDVEHASCDERQAGTGHASAECLSHEGSRNSGENVLGTERGSEEVSTVSQSGALCTPKDGGTDIVSSLPT